MKKLISIVLLALTTLTYSQSIENGIMHISFDDAIGIFQNLTDSAETYTSAFENPFLAELKRLHDSTGAKFSLYCFLKKGDWELAHTTTSFASEFSENSDWLKFGIHQGLTLDNYANGDRASVVADFEYFLTTIKNIVGNDSASIDLMPRLHNFAGNEISCRAFKEFGFKGFLGADDTRNSYYLTGDATSSLTSGDCHFDCANSLYIFKSETRLEKVSNASTFLANFLNANKAEQAKNLIIFTHEYECYDYSSNTITNIIIAKLDDCCNFAIENNYCFDYPQNIVRDSFCVYGYSDITSGIIKNPGFEDTSYTNGDDHIVPVNWTLNANLINADSKLIYEDTLSDNYYFSIQGESGSSIDFYQDLNLTKGEYIVKARLDPKYPDSSFVYVEIGEQIIKTNATGNVWNSWISVPVSFTLATDSIVRVGVSSTLAVMVDDFQLLKIPEVISGNKISKHYNNDFNILNNPVSSVLHLNVPGDFKVGRVKVYDINGRFIFETYINTNNPQVDVSILNHGLYFLNIGNSEYFWSTKFVKTND